MCQIVSPTNFCLCLKARDRRSLSHSPPVTRHSCSLSPRPTPRTPLDPRRPKVSGPSAFKTARFQDDLRPQHPLEHASESRPQDTSKTRSRPSAVKLKISVGYYSRINASQELEAPGSRPSRHIDIDVNLSEILLKAQDASAFKTLQPQDFKASRSSGSSRPQDASRFRTSVGYCSRLQMPQGY